MAAADSAELIELDSNFLVAARAADSPEGRQLEEWLRSGLVVQISAVAWSEYLCGPLDEDDIEVSQKIAGNVEPFVKEDAELASELFNKTGRRSRSHADCMIAAHAVRRHARLGDFEPAGLPTL